MLTPEAEVAPDSSTILSTCSLGPVIMLVPVSAMALHPPEEVFVLVGVTNASACDCTNASVVMVYCISIHYSVIWQSHLDTYSSDIILASQHITVIKTRIKLNALYSYFG